MFKQLPPGLWISIHNLPADTTDIAVQEFLARYAIMLPLENISLAVYPRGCFAKICITNEMVEGYLNMLLKDHKFLDRHLRAVLSRKERDFTKKLEHASEPLKKSLERR
ncbi:MAG TPA: hypothetical protein VMI32_05105 [Candidatus Solibacter sp.]|nr:hypothetical protein [Candidatus Solibacter sp.]